MSSPGGVSVACKIYHLNSIFTPIDSNVAYLLQNSDQLNGTESS